MNKLSYPDYCRTRLHQPRQRELLQVDQVPCKVIWFIAWESFTEHCFSVISPNPNRKIDSKQAVSSTGGEGVLANFFNSLLNKNSRSPNTSLANKSGKFKWICCGQVAYKNTIQASTRRKKRWCDQMLRLSWTNWQERSCCQQLALLQHPIQALWISTLLIVEKQWLLKG